MASPSDEGLVRATEIHRRQWLISREKYLSAKILGFKSVALSESYYLHHHPQLEVHRVGDLLVLGDFVGDLTSATQAHYLAGRFVVIDWPWLLLDAVGSMGVHFFKKPEHVICGSSVALISAATGNPIQGRPLTWGKGLNWDPPPSSRMAGLRRLFCDQALNVETGIIEVRPRQINTNRSEAEARAGLADYLAETMKSLSARADRLLLPLTAGRDSRALLSALLATATPFEAYTHIGVGGTSETDARIAARLASKYGFQHHIIAPDTEPDNMVAEVFLRHTGGCDGDAGKTLAQGAIHRGFREGDYILPAAVFEIGRRFYANRFYTVDFGSSKSSAQGVAKGFRDASPEILAPLRLWHMYRRRFPIPGLDYLDAFYLDQRIGGWLAAGWQGRDLYLPTVFPPATSWRCVELLMSASPKRRAQAVIQIGAMEQLVPGIASAEPINPLSGISRIRATLRSAIIGSPLEATARRLLERFRAD